MSDDLLPAIVFIFSRARCDEAAERLYVDGFRLTDSTTADEIERIAQRSCAALSDAERATLGYDGWLIRLRAGIAAHHAGMVPAMKEAVEETFAAGLTQIVFATETLALGINMPARSVVVENLSKYNGDTHELLTPGQYAQLSGRAGRRGMDDKGVSIVAWSPFVKAQEVGDLVATTDYPLKSAFVPTYNMVANLIDRHDRAETERLLGSSFAQFQADRDAVSLNRKIDRVRLEVERLDTQHADTLDRPVRPGDVVIDSEPLLVMATSTRKGGRVVLRAIDRFGRDRSLDGAARSFGAVGQLDDGRDVRAVAADRDALEAFLDSFASLEGTAAELAKARRRLSRLQVHATKRDGALVAQLNRVHQVLCTRGFADGWELTERGQLLKGLHGDRAIVLAAALGEHLFDGLNAAELAGVVSTLTYYPRSDDTAAAWVAEGAAAEAFGSISTIARSIAEAEAEAGLDQTTGPDAGFFAYTHGWVLGMGFEDLIDDQIGPGEFVRNIRQVGDVLSQIGRSAAVGDVASVAVDAAEALRRGVAAATLTESGALSDDDSDEPAATSIATSRES
ncbi:MAG: hypothetical protein IH940_09665 [Acidobacteria bacterium]|nr:hypothetical protein [Acidobacteriota bacterium]